ncbi:MAG: TrbG/VirB9 family P-type conjugative transfer protein [Acidithiobacillus ferriphilus]
MNADKQLRDLAMMAVLSILPGLAVAGVIVPKTGSDHQVPAIQDGSAASGADVNDAQTWRKIVAAPPSAKMSFRTRADAEKSLTQAYASGKLNNLPPIAGSDGTILYPYGGSWPTVVASPLHISIIELQAGCHPEQLDIGAPTEWILHQAMAGNTPILTISPRFAGLHTNLMITATSQSGKPLIYYVNLVSDHSKYTPKVGFYYPQDIQSTWHLQTANAQAAKAKADAETIATLPNINAADLDFRWKTHCAGGGWFNDSACGNIRPVRIFDDGTHTYIQMPIGQASRGGMPTIMAENSAGQPAIINWQYRDHYFIVDSVPHQILLLAGKGSAGKVVKITHR